MSSRNERHHVYNGWLVVLSGFFVFLITDGLIFSFGILLVEIVEQFQTSRATAGVVISIQFGLMNLLGPFSGALVELYGSRILIVSGAVITCIGFVLSYFVTSVYHLWITYGVLGAIGFGLMFMPTTVCVLTNLEKHRALDYGIAKCGSGVGSIIFSQLTRVLLEHVGLRGTFLIEGAIALNGAVFGLFLVLDTSVKEKETPLNKSSDKTVETDVDDDVLHPLTEDGHGAVCDATKEEKSNNENKNSALNIESNKSRVKQIFRSMFDWKLISDVRFILILLSLFIQFFGFGIPFNLLPDQVIENGMSKEYASWLVSSIGIARTASGILFGWFGDFKWLNRFCFSVLLLLLAGFITAMSPLLTTFATKMIYACVFGASIGGFNVLFNTALPDMFGDKMIPRTQGLVLFTVGIASFVSTPVGGLMFDHTGSYTLSFIFSGAVFLISGILLGICKIYDVRCTQGSRKTKITN